MDDKQDAIFTKFGFDISSGRKNKNGITAIHANTSYIIRKTDAAHGKLKTSYYIKEQLHKDGFPIIDRYFSAPDGNPFVELDGKTYIAEENNLNYFELSPCNFSVEAQRFGAINALSELHSKLSKITVPYEYKKYLLTNKPTASYYITRRKELTRAKKWIKNQSHMSDFDILFLRSYDKYIALTDAAIALTHSLNYKNVLSGANENEIIAHNKFKEENARIYNGGIYIVNFDNCTFHPQLFDLGDLIRRSIKKTEPNEALPIIHSILDNYTKINTLSQTEIQILFDRLLFPDKYLTIINRYYNKRKTWIPQQLVTQMQNTLVEQGCLAKVVAMLH